ncbi:MAG TPA: helix-turn-helix transcriptional regulator [Actinophytocola sp.]|uniref:helix-turn-helix domain-containing protein n=1 Tax=Actinophytocola sp. TaxID=1872138 RepID=UPI002DDCE5A9|nr:helix-turn-helix transcriptional regulator [Actinophytocola sp.]HEV2781484.1 helix-turn-helix transcriptional regulator [Actinophytocola sp.]
MNTYRKPPLRRRRLGKRLRAMRERAGLTLEQAAARLDMSRSGVFRLETGASRPNIHVLRSMMDLYDQWEEGLLDAARDAMKPRWFTAYGVADMGYVDVETEASRVSEYTCQHLPGLLQTGDYARALIEGSRRRRTAEQLESEVSVRLIRQHRLTNEEEPLELVAIIDEAALRREVGGPQVMHAQLRQLMEMAELPTVHLQVLPLEAQAYGVMDGAFTLLDFPEPEDQALLYHAYVTGALHIENEYEVREARLTFDQLRSDALNQADSVALIERLALQLYVPA